jgi:hypothetical protein
MEPGILRQAGEGFVLEMNGAPGLFSTSSSGFPRFQARLDRKNETSYA